MRAVQGPTPSIAGRPRRALAQALAALLIVQVLCAACSPALATLRPRPANSSTGLPVFALAGSPPRLTRVPISVPPMIWVATSTVASVPTTRQIATATKWIKRREGIVAFAVVASDGKLYGYHAHTQFVTASVVKAMLLVGYLRTHTKLSSWATSTLGNMIHVSDNNAATAIYHIVGDKGLRAVAAAAAMRNFSVSVSWGRAQLTPADQARFFFSMDKLIPKQHDAFARRLLSHITSSQSWGIPSVGRAAKWQVFFKGGWRTTAQGQLVHQVARLEKPHETMAIAVMTNGDPSMAYGIATIRGVCSILVGRSVR